MSVRARAERLALPGMGWCYSCKRPWKSGPIGVEYHLTKYTHNSSCFPLCEGCWTELGTPELRMPFYRMLWDNWNTGGFWIQYADGSWHEQPAPEPWPVIEAAVYAEADNVEIDVSYGRTAAQALALKRKPHGSGK